MIKYAIVGLIIVILLDKGVVEREFVTLNDNATVEYVLFVLVHDDGCVELRV